MAFLAFLILAGLFRHCWSAKIFSYSFQRNQCFQNEMIAGGNGSPLGYVYGDMPNVACINSDGVASKSRLRSLNTVEPLKLVLGSSPMAIEMWIQPARNLSRNTPIISIGQDAVSSVCRNNLVVTQLASPSSAFALVQCSSVGINTGDALISPEMKLQTTNGVPALVHLVMNIQYTAMIGSIQIPGISVNYTINGVSPADSFKYLFTSAGSFAASAWDNAGRLNIFPTMDISSVVSGKAGNLYYFALYSEGLATSAIKANYAARLSNSLPVVHNQSVTVQENGEVGDHSLQPEFYNQPIPTSDIVTVTLVVHDLENYAYGAPLVANRPKLLITTLPAVSKVYQVDGTEITSANRVTSYITYDTTTSSYRLRIRPPLDQYSRVANQPLDMFSFVAVDGVTGLRSAETAWMHVVVTHVNKPPIATRRSATLVFGGYKQLEMNGTDPDSAIVGAVITKNPSNGVLFQYNTYRTVNATTNEYTLQSGPPFRVLYEYTGPRDVDANNRVGGDSFQFCLVDVEGRRSVPVTYTLSVLSPIYSTAIVATTTAPRGVEDVRAAITLRGGDSSIEKNFLNAYIVTPPKLGNVYLTTSAYSPITTQTLLVGFIYRGNYTHGGVDVFYQGPENYFTTPTKTWNGTALNRAPDSFTFKIAASSGGDSVPARQYVHIKNVNDPSVLSVARSSVQMRRLDETYDAVSHNATHFTTSNTTSTTDTDYDSPVYTSAVTPGTVILSGFSVSDPDLGVDPVHITVFTRNASTFRLNSDHLKAVDFNSAMYCKSSTVKWICDGDGTVSSSSFVAAPQDAVRALNGMTVILDSATLEDTLVVTMYDGVGDNCLSTEQLGSGSIYHGCYSSSVSVKIYGSGSSGVGGGTNGVSTELMSRLMYVGIGLAVFASLVAWRFVLSRRKKNRKEGEEDEDRSKRTWLKSFKYLLIGEPNYPRRTRRSRASPGRTPKRRAHHSSEEESRSSDHDSDSSNGSDSESGESTAEEEYDVEAGRYRTPPRKDRGRESSRTSSPRAARTPQTPLTPQTTRSPRTPKIGTPAVPTPDTKSRYESFPNPCNRAKGEIPTETIIIYTDKIGPDGNTVTEETRVVVPLFANGEGATPKSSHKKARESPNKRATPLRAFPDILDEQSHHSSPRSSKLPPLGRAPSCNTSPLRSDTRLPGKRASHTPGTAHTPSHHRAPLDLHELREMNDFTDHTVSTMTCSVSSPHNSQSVPPSVRATPPRRAAVTSPESEASPMRTNSTHKHRTKREDYQYDGAGVDALTQVMRTPERVPQKHSSSESKSGSSRATSKHTEGVSESGTKQSSARKSRKGERSAEKSGREERGEYDSGVSIAGSVWSEHLHRSGRTFYHNAETGKSTWRRPAECM